MFEVSAFADRLAMNYHLASYRRVIAGSEVILHCHHYNARLQNTIESAAQIDGKKIILEAAEDVFSRQIKAAFRQDDDEETRWRVARNLYAHLGYGWFDLAHLADNVITASASHFIEGWHAGFPGRTKPVCTFTEGYLQASFAAVNGKNVWVRETSCIVAGAEACRFEIDHGRTEPPVRNDKKEVSFVPRALPTLPPSNIDAPKIIEALVAMPIHGDHEGLIPAFGVYLASTPADFYNRICIDFVAAMAAAGLEKAARKLLIYDAETCGMNTFRGIMSSPEWEGLVGPMIRNDDDNFFGVVAVSNALGWGNWHVTAHQPGAAARIESFNGYEAIGFRAHRGMAAQAECLMLTGVAAGIMELVYSKGSIADRFGTFHAVEHDCIASGKGSCVFHVEKA